MRATRLPEDWHPGRHGVEYAMKKRLSDNQIERCIEDFRGYWLSKPKDNTKLDWHLTWQGWVRKFADQHVGKPIADDNAPLLSYTPVEAQISPSESHPMPAGHFMAKKITALTDEERASWEQRRTRLMELLEKRQQDGRLPLSPREAAIWMQKANQHAARKDMGL